VAVADVLDALPTKRPYKQAWSPARAAAEVGEQAGRQLDPSVVEAFGALDHPSLLSRIGPGRLPHRSPPTEVVEEAVAAVRSAPRGGPRERPAEPLTIGA
jgi:hypothetical protein